MKRRAILAAVVAIGFGYTLTTVHAATVTLTIDGNPTAVPTFVDSGVTVIGTGPATPGFTYTAGGANGGTIELQGALDPTIPEIVYSSGVTDHGTVDSTFIFSFILDLASPQANAAVRNGFSGGVTNGGGTMGNVTVTALPPGGLPEDVDGITELMTYFLSDDGGTTWKNVNLDAGPTATIFAAPSGSTPYGTFNQGPIAGPAGGPWTHMRVDLNFKLSSGGDKFNFTGSASIPEPSALLLALLGVAAICGLGRRGARW